MTPLPVDIVSDVMCPWCLIGKRRFEKALAQLPALEVEVTWRPFQLDPTIPPQGIDRKSYLDAKFGGEDQAAEVYRRIRDAGETEGIDFHFERIAKSPNTLDAHRLIRWAGIEGAQDAVVERLFAMYFVEGRDLADHGTLTEAAADAGLDPAVIARLLEADADRCSVESEIAAARAMGVTGVPCFIIDNTYAVIGAQDPSVLASALAKRAGER